MSPSTARASSRNWEAVLRIFCPESVVKIRADLGKNIKLKNELAFLEGELKSLQIPSCIPKDSDELASIMRTHSQSLQAIHVEMPEEDQKIAQKQQSNLEAAQEAVSKANSLIEGLQETWKRLQTVLAKKKPENFTREDVWFIQPETKQEFDQRIARGDTSTWGHDLKEWEEGKKISEGH